MIDLYDIAKSIRLCFRTFDLSATLAPMMNKQNVEAKWDESNKTIKNIFYPKKKSRFVKKSKHSEREREKKTATIRLSL